MQHMLRRVDRFSRDFLEEVRSSYEESADVANINSWLRRFDQLTLAVAEGGGTYRQVEDHIFELKVIRYLRLSRPGCRVCYEPLGLDPDGRNVDLEFFFRGDRFLIEAKCFHPTDQETEIPDEYISPNNTLIMDSRTYHAFQATRGHLMDATFKTESKLANYDQPYTSVLAVPDGFHLNIEDLRDFVAIYRYGRPRLDDPLGAMTMHNLPQPFAGTINQFWALPFPQESFNFRGDREPTIVAPLRYNDEQMRRSA